MPGETNLYLITDAVAVLKEQIMVTNSELLVARNSKDEKWVKNVEAILKQQEDDYTRSEALRVTIISGGAIPSPTNLFGNSITNNGF